MDVIEEILVSVAVVVISGASALALGRFVLSFVIKDRRPS